MQGVASVATQLEDGQLPVIVLGTGNEPDGLYPYMAAGALAIVDKSSADFDELAETTRSAVNGDPRTLREWHLKTSRHLPSAGSVPFGALAGLLPAMPTGVTTETDLIRLLRDALLERGDGGRLLLALNLATQPPR